MHVYVLRKFIHVWHWMFIEHFIIWMEYFELIILALSLLVTLLLLLSIFLYKFTYCYGWILYFLVVLMCVLHMFYQFFGIFMSDHCIFLFWGIKLQVYSLQSVVYVWWVVKILSCVIEFWRIISITNWTLVSSFHK